MDIILGSASTRRKEILEYFSLPFTQASSNFDESSIPFTHDPVEYVQELALAKGKSLSTSHPNALIITADTDVYIDGTILGKPKNEQEAYSLLSLLSGRWHSVFTAIALTHKSHSIIGVEETKVLCNVLTPQDMQRAYKKHALCNKAGSYAVQKSASIFIKKIDGCYYNVMGFPINTFKNLLLHYQIDLWDYLKEID